MLASVSVFAVPVPGAASPGDASASSGATAIDARMVVQKDGRVVGVEGNTALIWVDRDGGGARTLVQDLSVGKASTRDLDTLGGRSSIPVAIDGDLIVGSSETADGESHAFAYDLSATTPTMRDLGTLGGRWSWPRAIDGNLVVGRAETAGGELHAFAYDLSATTPTMRDLGTLGGRESWARAVDGNLVVGRAETVDGAEHAFAMDLGAEEMTDLGTLGLGHDSGAVAVDGGVVVGYAHLYNQTERDLGRTETHAFAYDVTTGTMTELGPGWASAIDGDVVVGTSSAPYRGPYPFAYDLRTGTMRDLGVLGNGFDFGYATGIDGDIVVGVARVYADDETGIGMSRGFLYDLGAATPAMQQLGTLGGPYSHPTDVDGGVVVGSSDVDDEFTEHPTVWSVGPAFLAPTASVEENAGAVRLAVRRWTDTGQRAVVTYARTAGSAIRGRDFVLPPGSLTFEPGETRKTIPLTVTNDPTPERQETVVVSLSSATAAMGTPTSMRVTIRPSDQRPDAQVSTRRASGYVGDDVYNVTAKGQSKTLTGRGGASRSFYVRVQNDGNAKNTLVLRGSRPRTGSTVGYHLDGRNVTSRMRGPSGLRTTLPPGKAARVRVVVRLRPTAVIGSTKTAKVTAVWRGDGARRDAAKVSVRVVR